MDDAYAQTLLAEHEIKISHLEGSMKKVEDTSNEIHKLTISVAKMTTNMESMLEEQKKQSDRLAKIESIPSQNWQTFVKTILTGVVGIIIGYIFTQIGF